MPLLEMNYYEFANAWVGAIAAGAAVAVFALVLWLVQRFVPEIDIKFDLKNRMQRRARWPKRQRRMLRAPPPAPVRPQVEDDTEWQSISRIMDTRAERLQVIGALQGRAGQRVEAAQYALDRLLADCAAVMLTADATEQMQRRRAAIADVPAPEPGSLAA